MDRRRTLWVAFSLIALTLAGGTAARIVERAAATSTAPPSPDPMQTFAAAGTGPLEFAGRLDKTAVMQGGDGLVRMELVITGEERPSTAPVRVPTDLVVVLDRSGSMSGDKIEHARAAVRTLIDQLGSEDRFALVSYESGAVVEVPLAEASSDNRRAWHARVGAIGTAGGTNMSLGLDLGTDQVDRNRQAGRAPRVILISDGLANQGDSSLDGLLRRATRAAHGEYVLTTVGVGADFDENLMGQMARAGTGNFHFLATGANLDAILAKEFETTRQTVASGLTIRVAPGQGVKVVDASGYPLSRDAEGSVRIQPGSVFAGQERHLWITLKVPTAEAAEHAIGRFSLEYSADGERHRRHIDEMPRVATVADEEAFFSAVDVGAWEQAVQADEYKKLQRSVSRLVKEGRDDEALQQVRDYRDRNAWLNDRLKSQAVADNLADAEALERSVEQHQQGEKELSSSDLKRLSELGYR